MQDSTEFGIDALPYGVFSRGGARRVGVRYGHSIVDVATVAATLDPPLGAFFDQPNLDAFLSAGRPIWTRAREVVRQWIVERPNDVAQHSHDLSTVQLHLPFTVSDYVDFYSSREHAENVSQIFRPSQPGLQPNWLRLPVGYHGRAGTVVASGTPVKRPCGQYASPSDPAQSLFGPSTRFDVEVELGFVVGMPSTPGVPVPTSKFEDHVFGVVVLNDWSARDLQGYETVPLGPHLGKSFATSIGHWVTPLDALREARVAPPPREVAVHKYLISAQPWGLDVKFVLTVNKTPLSAPRFSSMYWTADQQLAHMTINGARLRTGDLYGSGTVSSVSPNAFGSLLEITRNGAEPVQLRDLTTRGFLLDGDEVVITATAQVGRQKSG